jgi:hypothetical protein
LFAVDVPAGAFDRQTGQGWTVSRAGTSARWRSKATVDGIKLVKLSWRDPSAPGLVSFKVKGKGAAIAVEQLDLPIAGQLRFDAPDELTGQCASLVFPGPPTGLGCLLSSGGARLLCR